MSGGRSCSICLCSATVLVHALSEELSQRLAFRLVLDIDECTVSRRQAPRHEASKQHRKNPSHTHLLAL